MPTTKSERKVTRRIGWALEVVALLMAWCVWEVIFEAVILFFTFIFAAAGALCLWASRSPKEHEPPPPTPREETSMTVAAQPWVDENRILGDVMPRMFTNGWPVIAELMQNCYRAGATKVSLRWSQEPGNPFIENSGSSTQVRSLCISDNGPGIPDWDGLRDFLTVGASGFEPEWTKAMPAGMGFYSLLAQSDLIVISSGFGSLEIAPKLWLNESEYRADTQSRITSSDSSSGLKILAYGCSGLPDTREIWNSLDRLRLYAKTMDITVQGKTEVDPIDLEDYFHHVIDLGGARLWWGNKRSNGYSLNSKWGINIPLNSHDCLYMSWFGHVVHRGMQYWAGRAGSPGHVYLEVYDTPHGLVPTPKLPDREEILFDHEDQDLFFAETVPKMIEHYASLSSDFYEAHTECAWAWHSLDSKSYKARSPVSVVWDMQEALFEDSEDQPQWHFELVQVAIPHNQTVHLLGEDSPENEWGDIPLVDSEGNPVIIEGEKSLTAKLDDGRIALYLTVAGNEGVFLQDLTAKKVRENQVIYLAKTPYGSADDLRAGDQTNLLQPTSQRLIVLGTPRPLIDGWVYLPEGVVWEIEWEDGHKIQNRITNDILRRPGFTESLDSSFIVGPDAPTEILEDFKYQVFVYEEYNEDHIQDSYTQMQEFSRRVEEFITQIGGRVPLIKVLEESSVLQSWIGDPENLISILIMGEDKDDKHAVVVIRNPGEIERTLLMRRWTEGGGEAVWNSEDKHLTLKGKIT